MSEETGRFSSWHIKSSFESLSRACLGKSPPFISVRKLKNSAVLSFCSFFIIRTLDARTLPHRAGICSKKSCPTVAEYAMLPSLRPVAEYYWQRSPTTLVGMPYAGAGAHELPPIDGLLAYWVGKYGGAV